MQSMPKSAPFLSHSPDALFPSLSNGRQNELSRNALSASHFSIRTRLFNFSFFKKINDTCNRYSVYFKRSSTLFFALSYVYGVRIAIQGTNERARVRVCVSYQDFTLDFYFRQFWTDPRLAFKKRTGVETLSVGSEFIKNIWVPDTFFVNEKQSYFHIATTSNEFIRIHHSGSITRSIR